MKKLALVLALLVSACATAPPPATLNAKEVAKYAIALQDQYIVTLKAAYKMIQTPDTDSRVRQSVDNAVTDCSRAFDQLDHATLAALRARDDEAAILVGNLQDVMKRADHSLKNLHAMMQEKPK